jgi:hypothetical protein
MASTLHRTPEELDNHGQIVPITRVARIGIRRDRRRASLWARDGRRNHMTLRWIVALAVMVVSLAPLRQSAQAGPRYVDEYGEVHDVADASMVPARYRGQAAPSCPTPPCPTREQMTVRLKPRIGHYNLSGVYIPGDDELQDQIGREALSTGRGTPPGDLGATVQYWEQRRREQDGEERRFHDRAMTNCLQSVGRTGGWAAPGTCGYR